MLIAFSYNIRHSYASASSQSSQLEADFDDQETIDASVKHIRNLGCDVLKVEANENAYSKLFKNRKKIDLLFNYSLGLNGKDRYSHIPAICEMLKIPYTGSGPLTQATVMNKARAKEVLTANGIPTPKYQLFYSHTERLRKNLTFPLIVKPNGQGSSAGITNDSVVNTNKELVNKIKLVIKTFNEPALVEEFLPGREFSVAMLGNPPEILPIIESDHSFLPKGYAPIDSLEVKWEFEVSENAKNLICPARIDSNLRKNITRTCQQTWRVLNIYDLCRIDLRCDKKGKVYVLETNSPPGLISEEIFVNSYFPYAARAKSINFEQILRRVINSAFKRYGINKKV